MNLQLNEMRAFLVICIGQFTSLLGTAMTTFAMTLWAYEITGKATPLAMINFFFVVPIIVLGPFTGVFIDRYNRKLMMMVSDLAAAATSLIILILYSTQMLQVWHLYITALISGTFQGFQWPAYSAAISLMLPKKNYGRANGLMSLADSGSLIFAPILAGVLIGIIGIQGILTIDLISVAIAVLTLLFVKIPLHSKDKNDQSKPQFFNEAFLGFQYILSKPSLLLLQGIFLMGNLFFSLAYVLFAPMILARSGNNEIIFATVQSAGAVGGVVGAVLMSFWGGPKPLIHGVLLGWTFAGFFGQILLGLGQGVLIWIVGAFMISFSSPILNGCNQAIWQSKVPPHLQGRVFSIRRCFAWLLTPFSALVAGPLADRFLEPAMMKGGILTPFWGAIIGEGKGAGIALLFVISGLTVSVIGVGGYFITAVRKVETIIPDHQQIRSEL